MLAHTVDQPGVKFPLTMLLAWNSRQPAIESCRVEQSRTMQRRVLVRFQLVSVECTSWQLLYAEPILFEKRCNHNDDDFLHSNHRKMRVLTLVNCDQSLEALDEFACLKCGQSRASRARIHSGHVHLWSEHTNASVDTAICLHAFEQLMECERVKEISVRIVDLFIYIDNMGGIKNCFDVSRRVHMQSSRSNKCKTQPTCVSDDLHIVQLTLHVH